MVKKSKYPECEKMSKVREKSQAIGEFLEWVHAQGLGLYRFHEHGDHCYDEEGDRICGNTERDMDRERRSTEQLLADFFEIDLDKVEREKRKMLKSLQGFPT